MITDPTKGIAVIISPKRAKRPHSAKKKGCPFCRGNEWMTPPTSYALPDKKKWRVRSFRNAFPITKNHEVIIETPNHDELFQDLEEEQLRLVWQAYQNRFRAFSERGVPFLIRNRGLKAGATIAHEHAQLLAFDFVPEMFKAESKASRGKCEFCRLLKGKGIAENAFFKAVVPEYARFGKESWIVCKSHNARFEKLSEDEGVAFLRVIQECVRMLGGEDYNVAFHTWNCHLHAEIYPRTAVYGGVEFGAGVVVNSFGKKQTEKLLKANR